MSGYSGETSFDFEVERYRNRETGKYLAYLLPGIDPDEFEYEYQVINLKVEGRSYFQPGKYSGPYEDSYPDEGETEIMSVIGPDGTDWESQLTHSERDAILDEIASNVQESIPEPEYEPDYDE